MKTLFYWGAVLFCLSSCNEKDQYKNTLLQLSLREKEIQCKLNAMQDSIAREWDRINTLLDETLPPDMPPEEKANMLKVRNANLIRMFESFEQVEDEVKQALADTELRDREMSKQIIALKEKVLEIESEKMALFEKISRSEGEPAAIQYRNDYQEAMKDLCE